MQHASRPHGGSQCIYCIDLKIIRRYQMQALIRKYNGRGIEDDGGVTSREFKQFARDFKKEAKQCVNADLVRFSVGHYDVSGFFERGGHYVYFSYGVPRGEMPLNMSATSALEGILVREAEGPRDYHGGMNRFTNFECFQGCVERLLSLD